MDHKIVNIFTKLVKYIIWGRIFSYLDIVSLYQYFDINHDDQNNNLIYIFCKIYIELFLHGFDDSYKQTSTGISKINVYSE